MPRPAVIIVATTIVSVVTWCGGTILGLRKLFQQAGVRRFENGHDGDIAIQRVEQRLDC